MRLYKDIVVDLYHPYPLPVMEAKQYDTGRSARVTLTADSAVLAPTEETVQIYAKKTDGTVVYATCTISNDYILVDFPEQAFATSGDLQVELYMDDGEAVLSTPIFEIKVYPSNMDARGITSSDDFAALVDALRDVETLKKTGLKGDKGDAATIQIGTVTASDPGSAPQVINVGTANAAEFNFVLPRGIQGPKGDPGEVTNAVNPIGTTEDDIGKVADAYYTGQAIGNLSELKTTNKGSLVAAVNEQNENIKKWEVIPITFADGYESLSYTFLKVNKVTRTAILQVALATTIKNGESSVIATIPDEYKATDSSTQQNWTQFTSVNGGTAVARLMVIGKNISIINQSGQSIANGFGHIIYTF